MSGMRPSLTMDPNMLYSLINMKLRNDYTDLNALARGLDLDRGALERRLREAGFVYRPALNQLRPAQGGADASA